ncbi:jg23306, partial [Pararge aegeria aegeria]
MAGAQTFCIEAFEELRFRKAHNGCRNSGTAKQFIDSSGEMQRKSREQIGEEKLKQLLHYMSARVKAFTMAGGYLNQWPWLRFILPKWSGYSIIMQLNNQMLDIIQ